MKDCKLALQVFDFKYLYAFTKTGGSTWFFVQCCNYVWEALIRNTFLSLK